MEISGKNIYTGVDPYVDQIKQNPRDDKPTEKAAAPVRSEDTVHLSREAQEIQEAQKAARAVPDVREDKVAEIQQRIEAGTYEINGNKIAFQMLRESLINQKA